MVRKKNLIPKISQTEKEALLAGTPWIEREFFTGRPRFKKIFHQEFPRLNEEEKAFLDSKVNDLCGFATEWELIKSKKLSRETEDFLGKEKFFGLTIPKEYGGKGFSHLAHAQIIEKLASYNVPLSIITMVPNSLGPAELLLKYGTSEQKEKYLSHLSCAREIPCFGLTEPQAGSDASSIRSEGVLFKDKEGLKIRLNWEKRWITLSSKATLIGLAVQLKDPEKLYSEKEHLGITCLLVSSQAPGIRRGLHHDPMGIPIYNAPISGDNVVVFAEEAIIGGLKNVGKGWKMLMECLSTGRGISLPSLSIGAGKRIAWLVGTHAFVRKQFGLSIGKIEGVQEALAPIAGLTHLMEATQRFTLSGLHQGYHSPVVAAITKHYLTETAQKIAKKGMDVMGGAGLTLGPRNKIASLYISLPIAITVEGANILTRTFIIYGQGLVKTHPYIYKLITALENNSLKNYTPAFWGFLYHFICNFFRSVVLSLTRGWIVVFPRFFSKEHRFLQKLSWSSSLFAFLSDLNLIVFGGRLKTKGRLSGRCADYLSYQYIAVSLLWYWNKTGRLSWMKTQWGLEYCFANIQNSLDEILKNYPHFFVRLFLKPLLYLLRINRIGSPPPDRLSQNIAEKLVEDVEFKESLCSNMYFPKEAEDQLQKLKKAFDLGLEENRILEKIRQTAGKKFP